MATRTAAEGGALLTLDPAVVGRVRTPTDVPLARVDQAPLDDLLE